MADDESKTCPECQGAMSPVVLMVTNPLHRTLEEWEYRRPGDSPSFWTGRYPTAGRVRAFMCGRCGRVALYGSASHAEPGAAADGGDS
jgi:hypothetical protein